MPIHISITADTAIQARALMSELLGQPEAPPVEVPVNEPAKPARAPRKAADPKPAAEAPGEQSAGAATEKAPATSTPAADTSATSASTSPSEPVTEASLRARATSYAAQAGPVALIEMQKVAGAANGKMSEIVASPDAMTKLDALLADAGF